MLIVAVSMIFVSCKKDEEKPDCETNNTGTIIVHNSENEPYNLMCNGTFIATLEAYEDYTLTKPAGIIYTLLLREKDYIILPTSHEVNWTSEQCTTDTWTP